MEPELMTKYEVARVMGLQYLRMQQMEVDVPAQWGGNLRAAVIDEMLRGENPCIIRRTMPDGTWRDYAVSAMELPREMREHLRYLLKVM